MARAPGNQPKTTVYAAVCRALTLPALVLLTGCGVVGVTPDDRELQVEPFGAVEFNLDLPNGDHIDTVDLHLVCAGVDQHHQVEVIDGELVAAFGGLTPGPCHVDISATSDQDAACLGAEDFTVVAGQTSEVTVVVLCQGRDEAPTGSVRLSTKFEFFNCSTDRIATLEGDPVDLLLGESTTISVDAYPGTVIGIPSVTFSVRNDATHTGEAALSVPPSCSSLDCVQVTCTGVGDSPGIDPLSGFASAQVIVAATLEDDQCFDTEAIEVTCLRESICGDSEITGIEQCDDSNTDNGDGCNSECDLEYCGDGLVNQVPGIEECDGIAGLSNPALQDCDVITCQIVPICGNGYLEGSEECDDDNLSSDDACTSACENAACGDGFLYVGVEECDDGNGDGQDACTTVCTTAECGDGFAHTGVEDCDDGNASNLDACLVSCETASCGDGFIRAGVEECEDLNLANDDACTNACQNAECGDGITYTGIEQCDDGNASNLDACTNVCNTAICGDGFMRTGVEQCDDANTSNLDACTNACNNAVCGDGFIRAGLEQCDDSNATNTDACTNACNNAVCGDGIMYTGVEQCDDGNVFNTDDCVTGCVDATCGDGYTRYGVEQCDDANAVNTDGCVTTCESALISDDFNRTDNTTIGGVWTEVTSGTANAEISGNKLRLNGDNGANRPLIKTGFTTQTTGVLMWSFDMDFTRTTEAMPYFQFMQLGDGMVDGNQTTGVAVDLTWGSYGTGHNQFGYKNTGGTFVNAMGGTTQLAGLHRVQVLVDLVSKTYDIRIDDFLRISAAPFRNAAVSQISQMRFFQHQMDLTATGRTIDNVKLTKVITSDNFTRANSSTIGGTWTEVLAAVNPGDAVIMTSRLQFNGANGSTSPLVTQSFTANHAGTMTWAFTMNFTRTSEATYFQFMQLGDGMSNTDQVNGVAVDLTWGSYGGSHSQFGYKNSAGTFVNVMGGTTALTLTRHIVVNINFATATYDIKIDGVLRATGVAFRDPTVAQVTDMRFFEDQMDSTATGRTIDNVALSLP